MTDFPKGGVLEQRRHSSLLQLSKWWKWKKTTNAGQEEMRNLIRQLVR